MRFLNSTRFPYCSGCGHHSVALNTARALSTLDLQPLDVVSISDIGCCGLIDPFLKCHTIHGLHGRACALAVGVRLGLDSENKKVIAFQGDGGSTIGLQHILEAARRNVDMTLIIQNNMLYGMTGGQYSGLSPGYIRERLMPNSTHVPPYDLVALASEAGAAYSARIIGAGNYSERLVEAFSVRGFSLVEIMEVCPSYGLESVKDLKMYSERKIDIRRNERTPYALPRTVETGSLLDQVPMAADKRGMKEIPSTFPEVPLKMVICGSAGEGVQTAASLLARSALVSGLRAARKGTYPITVGSGFSIGELILSPTDILFTGIERPDVLIIVSEDGLNVSRPWGDAMGSGTIVVDEELELPATGPTHVIRRDFRKAVGGRGAALAALSCYLMSCDALLIDALKFQAARGKHGEKFLNAVNVGMELY